MLFFMFGRNIGSHLLINKSVNACIGADSHVTSLEHVQARLTLSYNRRGNLAIHLISPAGTRSTLLHPRYVHLDVEIQCKFVNSKTKTNTPACHSPAGLMTTHPRVLMIGLSWPPTPGMRTPPGRGRWRLRMWLVPVTTVKHLCCLRKLKTDFKKRLYWWICLYVCMFTFRILRCQNLLAVFEIL